MSTFEEYAALARQLSEQLRAEERGAAAEAERRRGLHAAADQLGHRLAAQGQRLDQLGRAIGVPPPAPPATAAGAAGREAPSGAGPLSGPGVEPTAAPLDGPGTGVAPVAGPGPGAGGPGGAAAAPGRPVVGAYPEVAGGPARLALPTAATTTAAGVPAQRAAEVDPGAELEAARRLADEADRHGQQAEALALRPALLPTWSPLARALAVYSACALGGAVLMMVMVVISGIGLIGGFTLGAWICAGLPVVSFVAGYLVLGRWGRPVVAAGPTPRHVPVGFVICVVLVPVAYCAYLLLFRALR